MMGPGFYINLDRVPDRARHMEAELRSAGIDAIERSPACDARAGVEASGYVPATWGPYWSLTPTDIACFESHRALWARVAASELAHLVFEDDILAAPELGAAASELSQAAETFDLIKLDGAPGTVRLGPVQAIAGYQVRPVLHVLPSAAAYLLSPVGADKLIRYSERYCDHADDFISRPRPGWRAFQLVPALVVQGMFATGSVAARLPKTVAASERTADPRIDAGHKQKGPLLYRLGKELRRGGRRIARAAWADRQLLAAGGLVGEIPLAEGLGPYRPD